MLVGMDGWCGVWMMVVDGRVVLSLETTAIGLYCCGTMCLDSNFSPIVANDTCS
jgi:hypothetical protein